MLFLKLYFFEAGIYLAFFADFGRIFSCSQVHDLNSFQGSILFCLVTAYYPAFSSRSGYGYGCLDDRWVGWGGWRTSRMDDGELDAIEGLDNDDAQVVVPCRS